MSTQNTPIPTPPAPAAATPDPEAETPGETPEPDQRAELPPEVKRALAKANREALDLRLKLKEYEDRDKSEAERQADRVRELEARNATLELDNLRRDVAAEKGLTSAQARRLSGSTREELEADADDLLETFPAGPATPPAPTFTDVGQGFRGTTPSRTPKQDFADWLLNARAQKG